MDNKEYITLQRMKSVLTEENIKLKYGRMVNLTKDNISELLSFNRQVRIDILSLVKLLNKDMITYEEFKKCMTLIIGYDIISNDVLKRENNGKETDTRDTDS